MLIRTTASLDQGLMIANVRPRSRHFPANNIPAIYPTKVDWWIALILIFAVVMLAGSAVPLLFGPPAHDPRSVALGVLCLLVAVWTGWIPLSTNYEIGQAELVIRSAGFRRRISLDAIVEVFPTHNPLSSPGHR